MWWNKARSRKAEPRRAWSRAASRNVKPLASPMMLSLEPRMLFDGAVVATVADSAPTASDATAEAAEHTTPDQTSQDQPAATNDVAPVAVVPGQTVVFIDARVTEADSLLDGIAPGTQVVALQDDRDGLQQIADYLDRHHGTSSVQIIAHGNAGNLWLGDTYLTAENLAMHSAILTSIGEDMNAGGDILIYACNTAAGESGLSFVNSLAELTGRDIAASSNRTGIGGDWNLEIATGSIESAHALSPQDMSDYEWGLATWTATNNANTGVGSLRAAIASAQNGDIVTFNSNMTVQLTSQLLVNKNITIDGDLNNDGAADVTLDGQYRTRVLEITSGSTVTVEGIVLTRGLVSGTGGNGGYGATGAMGGGIFNAGNLTLRNVTVTSNAASGGGGGGGVTGAFYGGGGGGGGGAGGQGGGHGGSAGPGTGTLGGQAGSGGIGGYGGGYDATHMGGRGGTSTGGAGGLGVSYYSNGGSGASATNGTLAIGGGGGGAGWDKVGGAGGNAAAGIYNASTGTLTVVGTSVISNNVGAGGGGGGGGGQSSNASNGGMGGRGVGAVWNRGTMLITAANFAAIADNAAASGLGGAALGGGTTGTSPTSVATIYNDGGVLDTAYVPNDTPAIASINGDSVAWAGVGNTVVLDSGGNASLTDTEFGALNSGNGNWSGGSLAVQRSGTAVSADTFGFNTSGALFTVSGSNLQSGGLTFATFTNSGGVLTISFTSSGTAATTALVNDIAQRVTYRSDTPAGDATVRFTLSDGSLNTTADVTVSSDTIYVTNTTDTATINAVGGVSFSEAIAIAAADATGSQTIVIDSALAGQTVSTTAASSLGENLTLDLDSASGVTLSGGTLSISSSFNLTTTNGAGDTATIATTLAGAGGLTKTGAGTVTLSGANSYTGATSISAGTLALSGGSALANANAVAVSGGAGLTITSSEEIGSLTGTGTVAINTSQTLTVGNAASSSFGGNLSGAGGLTVSQSNGNTNTLTLTGDNSGLSGQVRVINYGRLIVNGENAIADSAAVTVNANGILTLQTDQTIGSLASNLASASIDIGSFTLTAGGNNGSTSVFGAISGTGNLIKQGSGTWTLEGTNTYSGNTTVAAGTLSVIGGSALIDNTAVTVASGATLDLLASETIGSLAGAGAVTLGANTLTAGGNNTSTTFSGGISGSGGLTKAGSGTLTLSGSNTYGATTLSAGTLSVASDGNLGSDGITLAAGSTLAVSGATNIDNAIALSGGTVTMNTAANATLSGNITGAGGLTKTGASALTLSGTDSFTGATTLNAGSLLINGALSATANTTVASGTTLGGSGSISSNVTVNSGGTLSPGNSAGTLTINGDLTMASGSTLAVEINSATAGSGYDQVIVNGAVDVSGATLSVTHGYAPGSGDTYTVIVNDAADAVTGNFSGVSEGSTVIAGGNSTELTARYIDGTGNDFTLTAPVDPFVTAVTVLDANGTYNIGDTVTVAVDFSEPIFLSTGTIQLTLETGATDRVLSYTAGSGSSTLYFNYTVQEGDNSLDLDYISTAALAANGDTIQNGSFIDAVLTLPTPGAAGSIAASKAIVIDGVRPSATVVVADTALAAGETSTVTITFNEAVTGFTTADLSVANGVVSSLSSGDGGVTWTATFTPTTSVTDATNLITLDNTGVLDAADNAGTSTTDSNNYAIDTLRPTAAIVVADTALAAGETSTVTITFNEAVSGLTSADFTVANGALSSLSSADGGITWTATLTPTASVTDTTNLITLDNTGVVDVAGNTGSGTTDSNNYAIDTVRPTVAIVVADTALAAGETSLVTITFSEAVSGLSSADFTVANGALNALSSSDGGVTWTATLTPTAGVTDTSNLITLDNTGVADAGGNTGSGTTDSNNYTIDTARPTATIAVADTALGAGETSLVTLTFSEAVSGLTTADLTVANGALSGLSSSDGGITWTATLTPGVGLDAATNIITLDNTGVSDGAGNTGSGTTNSNNYAIDTAPPTASIAIADTVLTTGETALVTITFNEAVTGLTSADFTVANGALSNLGSSDGGITWTATLTPTTAITDTTNVITLDNSGIADIAGNAGSGTTDSANYVIDTAAPVVATVSVPPNGVYVAGQNLDFTVSLSEAVVVDTTTGTPRLAITLDTGGIIYASYVAGSGSSTLVFRATVASGQLDSNGIALGTGIELNGGTIRDGLGNGTNVALNGVASTSGVLIDAAAPVIASVSLPADGQYVAGDVLTFTVNTSEAVIVNTAAGAPRLALDIGGNTAYATYVSGSGSTALVFSYTVQSGDNDSDGISIGGAMQTHGATLRDAAGNDIVTTLAGAGATAGIHIDAAAPLALGISRNDNTNSVDTVTFTLTFSEAVSGVDTDDFSLLTSESATGVITSVQQIDGSTYLITVGSVTGSGALGITLDASGSGIVDGAGNALQTGVASESYLIGLALTGDPEFRVNPPTITAETTNVPLQPSVPTLSLTPTQSPLLPMPLFDTPTLGSGVATLGNIFIDNGATAPSYLAQVFANENSGDGGASGFLGFRGGDGGVFGSSSIANAFGERGFNREAFNPDSLRAFAPLKGRGQTLDQRADSTPGAPTLQFQLQQLHAQKLDQIEQLAWALQHFESATKRA